MSKKKEIRKEVLEFRAALSKVVSLLTARSIPVVDMGDQARCEYDLKTNELKRIVIPSIPDDASDNLLFAIRGFIDHEVAHVLFTDSKIYAEFAVLSNAAGQFVNSLEDVFVERKMSRAFIGSKGNLLKTQQYTIDKYYTPRLKQLAEETDLSEISPRDLLYGHLFVPMCRAYCGQTAFVDFVEPYLEIIKPELDILEKISFKSRINRINHTIGSVRLAADLIKLLKLEAPSPSLAEREAEAKKVGGSSKAGGSGAIEVSGSGGASSIGGGKGGEVDPSKESASKPEEVREDTVEEREAPSRAMTEEEYEEAFGEDGIEEDSGSGKSEESSSETGEEDETSAKPEEESTTESESGESSELKEEGKEEVEEGESGEESDELSEEEKKELKEELSDAEDLEDMDIADDSSALESLMRDEISSTGEKRSYTPYTRVLDFMDRYENAKSYLESILSYTDDLCSYRGSYGGGIKRYKFNIAKGLDLFAKCVAPHFDKANAGLAKELERLIASKNKTQFVPGQRKGKIHPANLYRLTMNDDRVFRKKEEFKATNAAVQIIVDLSGSMSGNRVETALASAYIISDALDKIKVPNLICGFTTHGDITTKSSDSSGYHRYEPLMLPILKDWNERAINDVVMARLGLCSREMPLENNADGESILALSQLIATRTEDRKMVFVLSDGQPACVGSGQNEHLKRVVRFMEKSGLEVLGIGISTDAPKHFYSKSVLLSDVKDLGKTLLGAISGSLL